LDISDDTIRRLIASGKVKAIRVGNKWLIPDTEAQRILSGALGSAPRRIPEIETAALCPALETR
jgi:excisionase family DNA binding protein